MAAVNFVWQDVSEPFVILIGRLRAGSRRLIDPRDVRARQAPELPEDLEMRTPVLRREALDLAQHFSRGRD